jgi:hypothetical protein
MRHTHPCQAPAASAGFVTSSSPERARAMSPRRSAMSARSKLDEMSGGMKAAVRPIPRASSARTSACS